MRSPEPGMANSDGQVSIAPCARRLGRSLAQNDFERLKGSPTAISGLKKPMVAFLEWCIVFDEEVAGD
jgi:hypothetical protein